MSQKRIESKSLIVSCVLDFIMAIAGFFVFWITNIQALFLDGFFSLIGCLSCLSALTISKISRKKTKNYPNGIYFLEPLYAIFKSLLTFSLLIFSVYGTSQTAWNYFVYGVGEPLLIEPIIPYAILMVIMCFGLGFYNKRQNHKTNNSSTILTAETKGNFVDGILSLGVGLAAVLLKLTNINGSFGFLHYTGDFFITSFLVLFSLKEPVQVLISSFRELSGGTANSQELKDNISHIIEKNLCGIISQPKYEIYKTGMHIKICIYLSKPVDFEKLQTIKKQMLINICTIYENTEIIFCQ